MQHKISYILLVVLLWSCATQDLFKNKNASPIPIKKLVKNIKQQTNEFDYLKAKVKVKPDFQDQITTNLNALLVVQNNKKVWANVSKFGISGARALVQPNRFQIYLKLEKKYIDGDFSYLNQLLKVDFINYTNFQNLLLGKSFTDFKAADYILNIKNNQYHLTHQQNKAILANPAKTDYTQEYWFNGNLTLAKAKIYYPQKNISLTIEYQNYTQQNNTILPKNVKILIKDKKEKKIDLEYSNFEFQKSPTPYKVPEGYTKKEF